MEKLNLPKISIIIPVAPNCSYGETLNSIRKSGYPSSKLEISLIFGRNPSKQRNEGIKKAKGEILLFLDNDSAIGRDYFSRLVSLHKTYDIVGGPALTVKTDTFLQKCFGYALGSYFASQRMQARFRAVGKRRLATESELILCNLSIKRNIFIKYGGFNEDLYPNEENELLNRLQAKGIKAVYDPALQIFRSQRENVFKFMKQLFNYGWSRMTHIRAVPHSFSPLFLLPLGFIVYLAGIFLFGNAYLIPGIIYLFFAFIFAVKSAFENKQATTAFILPFLFILVHLSYGAGIFYGLFKIKKQILAPIELKMIRV